MRMIAPRTGGREVTFAEDQTEYAPLTVAVHGHSEFPGARVLLTRWTFTPEERAAIAAGEDVYIGQLNFDRAPMTPLIVTLGAPHLTEEPR